MFHWIESASAANLGVASIGLALMAGILAVNRDWRVGLGALALQAVFQAILVATLLPAPIALVKLVTGWLTCSILLLACLVGRRSPASAPAERSSFAFLPFRLVAAVMVAAVAAEASNHPGFALPGLPAPVNTACYVILALALLHLGLTDEPLRAGLALLTFLAGFEIFYAAVEPSLAVMALMAGVNFSVALAIGSVLAWSARRTAPEGEA